MLVVTNGQAIQIAEEGKEVFTEEELDELLGELASSEPNEEAGGLPVAAASVSTRQAAVGGSAVLLLAAAWWVLPFRRGRQTRRDKR